VWLEARDLILRVGATRPRGLRARAGSGRSLSVLGSGGGGIPHQPKRSRV